MHFIRSLSWPILVKPRRLLARFERAAEDPRAEQQRVLLEKIRRNESSDFGREHGFASIRSVEDFRRRMPIASYEDFAPWIERVKHAETSAMFGPSERILMFAVTSGTYSTPKHIPVTGTFLREYTEGWHVWGMSLAQAHLEAYDHTILRMVSPSDESRTEGGIPCGAISGLITDRLPSFIRRKYTPPARVAAVKHAPSKYYLTARVAVGRNVSMISTANPSTALAVVRSADENCEGLIRDVRDGGVSGSWEVPDEVLRSLRWDLRPRPRLARALEQIVSRTGRLRPKDYWPELALVANWKGGSCGVYLARYPEYFADTPVRDIGLMASEGRMTIPLSDEGSGGALDISSHFFEFIPEAEIDSRAPATLLADELEAGKNYFIVPTTSSGLYRYNLMDLVRVTGFFRRTPELTFLSKGALFSSLTGEKVSEFQVVESLGRARALLKDGPLDGLFTPMRSDPPRYSLSVERIDGASRETWRGFLRVFEEHLQSINVEYASKRASDRLGAPVLHVLSPGSFDAMKEAHLAKIGGRREQYKHRFVVGEIDFHKRLSIVDRVEIEPDRAATS